MKKPKPNSPDFAYPQTVAQDALEQLKAALESGDGQSVVDALIKVSLAETMVSNDAYPEVISRVESVIAAEKQAAVRSLLNLLLAKIYNSYYAQNRYNINRRTTVEADSADITLMSGEQFKTRICDLVKASLADPEALQATPLTDFPQVIEYEKNALEYFPTLFDFMSEEAIYILNNIETYNSILPSSYLSDYETIPANLSAIKQEVLRIVNGWVAANPEPGAPRVKALVMRFNNVHLLLAESSDDTVTDAAIQLYSENSASPYAVEILLECASNTTDAQKTEIYRLLNDFIKANPGYPNINCVKNRIAEMSTQGINVNMPGQVAKGVPFAIKVNSQNAASFDLKVYRVRDAAALDPNADDKTIYLEKTPYLVIPVKIDEKVPFNAEVEVTATIDKYGVYVIETPYGDNSAYLRSKFYCSDLTIINSDSKSDKLIGVVNAMTGAPVQDATVTFYRPSSNNWKQNWIPGKTRVTRADGILVSPVSYDEYEAAVSLGDDRFSPFAENNYYRSDRIQDWTATSYIHAALPVYHPGDSLSFAGIAYKYKGNTRKALTNKKVKVTLVNPNWEEVDTIAITTDDFGRFSGRFSIPKEGITGYFRLNTATKSKSLGSCNVMVSDYKLPTYEVTVDAPTTGDDGSVEVTGKAMTYSGFPVANANVRLTLGAARRFWFFDSQSIEFDSQTATTAADGTFKFTLTPELLALSPYPKGFINADILVTSPTGENQTGQTHFSLGKQLVISANITGTLSAKPSQKLDVTLLDRVGNPVDAKLLLTFTKDGKSTEITALANESGAVADLSRLASGTYSLTVKAVGYDAEPQTIEDVVVYNDKDSNSPSDEPLWVLKTRMSVPVANPVAEIVYAVPEADASVLMIVSSADSILEHRWIKPSKGVNTLRLKLKPNDNGTKVTLFAASKMRRVEKTVLVNFDNPDKRLSVKVERLRDRLVPLKKETITVHVSDGSGKGIKSAVILDMYAKSLLAIENNTWEFSPIGGYIPSITFSTNYPGNTSYFGYQKVKSLPVIQITDPYLNLYGQMFGVNSYKSRVMYSCASPLMNSLKAREIDFFRDDEADDCVEASYDSAAGSADLGVAESEEDAAESPEKAQTYRPSEVPLAFFEPTLTTNKDGSLTYTFTVPDANTTWVFNALAFNAKMVTDMAVSEVISSKPLMVEPNLPRFIRQGDKAMVSVSVMNASTEPLSPVATFEILDPVDRHVISTASADCNVEPGTSTVVVFPVDGPADTEALLVRIKASTDTYSDGVQTILPVLPDSQTVYDAQTFYIPVGETSFSTEVTVPNAKQSTTTLTFCDNPTWEVVSALPGLRSGELTGSLEASAAIFSASVSKYVMDLNPQVEEHLSQWLDGAKDSGTLLSMLNSNEDLKQLVLSSTPWMPEARSDNERITNLALLFDPANISSSIDSAIATLEKLQQSDGGWAWTAAYPCSSTWVTYLVLNNFAELRQLGCCPARLNPMIEKGLKYLDAEISRAYDMYPKDNYFFYTDTRSLYLDVKISGSAAKAYDSTVKALRSDWKNRSTIEKAAAALILYRNGYKADAVAALNSLRQFATYKPALGMWWDSVDGSSWWSLMANAQTAYILDAFNTIEPGCVEVDRIRQWLILNKVVQDWGTSVNTSAIVASILKCGSNWLYKPGNVSITLGKQAVVPTEADRLTGQFVVRVDNPNGRLDIKRGGEGPAWGAVLTRSNQTMKQIAAASLPELSVTKEILVDDGSGWHASDNLAVGQVAKIRLIIDSARDMDYVTIVDQRAACMEPVIQTPRNVYCDGIFFYLENRDDRTNLFIDRLPKGRFIVEYEMNVNNAGEFASGIATLQSQYAPEFTAHSAGTALNVR